MPLNSIFPFFLPLLNETLSRRSVTCRKFCSSSDCTNHRLSVIDQTNRCLVFLTEGTYAEIKVSRSGRFDMVLV